MDMYCAIGINRDKTNRIEKVVTKNLSVILSFDAVIAFTILKTTGKIKSYMDYDTYLDYWYKTHDENVIASRSLGSIISHSYTLGELTEIRSILLGIDSHVKDTNIKKRIKELYAKLFGGID